MKVQIVWDERYPDLTIYPPGESSYCYADEIELPEEDYKQWAEAWITIRLIEDKVKAIESMH